MKKKLSIISISCFVATILSFILTLIISHYIATNSYNSNVHFGYTLAILMMIAIIGFILAFVGEKGTLKITGIVGNLFAFFTISVFVTLVFFYTTP
ncbi:hypothetical protein EI200_23700 [Peribacillus simplex]|uniref:hypothetical protein n=1 Tax=Peribacillus simplex TaxID=1478 RepID=UPI000F632D13|nr:hypothetical protein [Peribacillus simplex]RRN67164.1 hypothetical protein EI200_23700 [Peribacillus simplex]